MLSDSLLHVMLIISKTAKKAPQTEQYINLQPFRLWMQLAECIEAISVGLIVSAISKLFACCSARCSEESDTELIAAVDTSTCTIDAGC
jgi:hypothetical protein